MKRIHILIALFIVLFVLFVSNHIERRTNHFKIDQVVEPNWLIKKYGPKHFSQHDEELIIRDFFHGKRNGIFVDVGANHYRTNSTTYYLEKFLGWRGIAVDALCKYKNGYERFRKNTVFFCFYVADRSDEVIDFYINEQNPRISTGLKELAEKQGRFEKIQQATITLNDLLDFAGLNHFDLLSMDIELAEPPALAGFDIQKYLPDFVCIEAHEEIRKKILDYFSKNHYQLIKKYCRIDPLNYYFAPSRLFPDENQND